MSRQWSWSPWWRPSSSSPPPNSLMIKLCTSWRLRLILTLRVGRGPSRWRRHPPINLRRAKARDRATRKRRLRRKKKRRLLRVMARERSLWPSKSMRPARSLWASPRTPRRSRRWFSCWRRAWLRSSQGRPKTTSTKQFSWSCLTLFTPRLPRQQMFRKLSNREVRKRAQRVWWLLKKRKKRVRRRVVPARRARKLSNRPLSKPMRRAPQNWAPTLAPMITKSTPHTIRRAKSTA